MNKEEAIIFSTGFTVTRSLGAYRITLYTSGPRVHHRGPSLLFSTTYSYNDMDSLERQLKRCGLKVKLIVVDGFSAWRRSANLPEIVRLARALVNIMVDEAHSLGVMGGLQWEGVRILAGQVDLVMGTLASRSPQPAGL